MMRNSKSRKGQQAMTSQFENHDDCMLLFSMNAAPQNIASITCSKHSIPNRLTASNTSKPPPNGSPKTHLMRMSLPLARAYVPRPNVAHPGIAFRVD